MADDTVYIVEEGEKYEGSWIVLVTKFRKVALAKFNEIADAKDFNFGGQIVTVTAYNSRTGNQLKSKSLVKFGNWRG